MLNNEFTWRKASKYLIISALTLSIACSDDDEKHNKIWKGKEITFSVEKGSDWTLPENQDRITDKVVFARQNNGPVYNYQWWTENFGEDALLDDLEEDFYGDGFSEKEFIPVGGTRGVKWAILENGERRVMKDGQPLISMGNSATPQTSTAIRLSPQWFRCSMQALSPLGSKMTF